MAASITRRGAGAAVRIGLVAGVFAALGWASTASAGDQVINPSVFVDTDCQQGQGVIIVTVTNGSYPVTYDITIDNVLEGDDVVEGSYTYGPYAAGDYEVVVEYNLLNGTPVVDDDTWTVEDCGGAPTTAAPTTAAPTTAAPTTAAPTTAAPTTAAPTTAAGSGAANPTLPATGQASGNLVLTAVLLTAAGGALVLIVRQARRA